MLGKRGGFQPAPLTGPPVNALGGLKGAKKMPPLGALGLPTATATAAPPAVTTPTNADATSTASNNAVDDAARDRALAEAEAKKMEQIAKLKAIKDKERADAAAAAAAAAAAGGDADSASTSTASSVLPGSGGNTSNRLMPASRRSAKPQTGPVALRGAASGDDDIDIDAGDGDGDGDGDEAFGARAPKTKSNSKPASNSAAAPAAASSAAGAGAAGVASGGGGGRIVPLRLAARYAYPPYFKLEYRDMKYSGGKRRVKTFPPLTMDELALGSVALADRWRTKFSAYFNDSPSGVSTEQLISLLDKIYAAQSAATKADIQAKARSNSAFQSVAVKSNDPNFQYDKRVDAHPTEKSEWDEDAADGADGDDAALGDSDDAAAAAKPAGTTSTTASALASASASTPSTTAAAASANASTAKPKSAALRDADADDADIVIDDETDNQVVDLDAGGKSSSNGLTAAALASVPVSKPHTGGADEDDDEFARSVGHASDNGDLNLP